MIHREERSFVVRLEGRAEFAEDYDGDADGYAWAAEFDRLKARVYAAVMREVRLTPGFAARPTNRGRPSDEEVTILCELQAG